MEITRLTLPSFPALTSAQIEAWLRIDAGQDAAALDMLVGSATEYVEGVTGRCLGFSTYSVAFDDIAYRYRIPVTPVQSVTDVQTIDAEGELQTLTGWKLERSGYLTFPDALPSGAPIITLDAGYSDNTGIPVSLCHAIAVLVSEGYNSREAISDQTVKTVERLCQRYKRVGVVSV